MRPATNITGHDCHQAASRRRGQPCTALHRAAAHPRIAAPVAAVPVGRATNLVLKASLAPAASEPAWVSYMSPLTGAACQQTSPRSRCSHLVTHAAAATAVRTQTTAAPAGQVAVLEVPRGETAGAVMVVDGVTIQAGDRDLMKDVGLRVMPGQRWGLVGANGCGKSTLLRALCGMRPVDAGKLLVAHKVEVGYLAQTAVSGSQRSVWQEARSHMTRLASAEADMAQAQADLEAGDVAAAEHLASAQEAWAAAGGQDADKRIANVLTGLGFRQEQFHLPASQFSGGWQMRIALARLLLGEAGQAAAAGHKGGLMLLDEPTNHLDSAAIKWLGNFLKTSGGTLVIVSHDEALLEDVCDHIAEVRGQKLHQYTGSYASFMNQRKEREQQAVATAAAQQAEIERLEAFVKRFGAKASKASQAQSKAKLADKLRAEMVEVPTAASALGGGDAKKVTLVLPRAPPCFTDVLKLQGASVGWGDAATPGNAPLLTNVDLTIKKGQRVLVLGPNGAGKSTLLKALSGSVPLWQGTRTVGDGVKLGVFSQDLAQDLPLEKTALEYVEDTARAVNRGISLQQCRQALGALGLTNSMALQQIGVLSGGEKARVALAAFALVPSNVLLLDEASNHLDAATIAVLTGALQQFDGAIVAITHNPAFAASLNATHVLRVQDGGAKLSTNMGLTDKDFEHTPTTTTPTASTSTAATKSAKRSGTPPSSSSSSSSGGGKAVSKASDKAMTPGGKRSGSTPPRAATPSSSASASSSSSSASSSNKGKRTTLSWNEQQEYKKLCVEVKQLEGKRDVLQKQLAQLAAGTNFKAVEAASTELGAVTSRLEEVEIRWLELAELAGDL